MKRLFTQSGPTCDKPYVTNALFNISGMSYGALSKPAVKALSSGAAKADCWLNTGESGLSSYHLEGGADVVFQIGTAKYGVRDALGNSSDDKLREVAAHDQVRMFELKLSQGAPGKGGILPGRKVSQEIAQIRGIPAGKDSISPNRHPDINFIGELLVTPAEVAWALCVGADFVVSARGFMFALGYIQALQCNKNTCPTGITTHNSRLQKGLVPAVKAERVGNHVKNMVHEVGVIAHACGVREPRQLRRFHARIVTENRHSVWLEDLYAAQSKQNETNR